MLFCAMNVVLGLMTLGGLACLIRPDLVAAMLKVVPAVVVAVGILLLLMVVIYLGLAAFVHRPIRIRAFELPVPRLRIALGQVAIGTADFLMVSAVLYQLLPASIEVGFLPVAAAYVVANTAAIITHVPGGLGVIEAVLLFLVPGANMVGAVVAFRVIYFLIPFVIGGLILGVSEIARRQRRAAPQSQPSSPS
jgi:hypothetical protein